MHEGIALPILEPSQVGEGRRAVTALAGKLGFEPTACGQAALIVTEMGTNLHKHGREGQLVLQPRRCGQVTGIDVLALDKGPGIADLSRCLRDGFSTSGTPGTGLGAIRRQSALFDLYSRVPEGTVFLARLWQGEAPPAGRFEVGSVCIPLAGEDVSGDAWTIAESNQRVRAVLADGLGHGLSAADASGTAVRILHESSHLAPAELLEAMHYGLRGTRGAAIAVAELDSANEVLRYAGVGNIVGAVASVGVCRRLVSHNGTVGHDARKFQEFSCPFPKGAVLVMHSDGLSSRWDMDLYPGILGRDPSLIAGVLYRDAQRGRDDATVLVLRAGQGIGE